MPSAARVPQATGNFDESASIHNWIAAIRGAKVFKRRDNFFIPSGCGGVVLLRGYDSLTSVVESRVRITGVAVK
jgi:hypothetical protein